jgi:hypothetical protein
VGQGLGVLDDRRNAVQPGRGRERRPDGRHAAIPGEGVQQGRLLAGDVGAGALPHAELDARVGSEDEVAGEMRVRGLADRGAKALDRHLPVAPDRHDRLRGTDRVGRDQEALDDEVRISLHQGAVAKRARIGPHRVGDDDPAVAGRISGRAPLRGRRVAGAAASTEAGALDLGDDHLGGQLRDRPLQPGVAAMLSVAGDAAGVDPADIGQEAALTAWTDPDLRRESARHQLDTPAPAG